MEVQKAERVTQYERNDVKEQGGSSIIVVMLNRYHAIFITPDFLRAQ